MSFDSAKSLKDKELRGRILKALNTEFPAPLSVEMLLIALRAARYSCTTGQLKTHLAYLAEKGYLTIQSVGVWEMDLARDMVKLTADGVDVVAGNIPPAPGVIINA